MFSFYICLTLQDLENKLEKAKEEMKDLEKRKNETKSQLDTLDKEVSWILKKYFIKWYARSYNRSCAFVHKNCDNKNCTQELCSVMVWTFRQAVEHIVHVKSFHYKQFVKRAY